MVCRLILQVTKLIIGAPSSQVVLTLSSQVHGLAIEARVEGGADAVREICNRLSDSGSERGLSAYCSK